MGFTSSTAGAILKRSVRKVPTFFHPRLHGALVAGDDRAAHALVVLVPGRPERRGAPS
jgi:hypothetical protein